MARGLDHIVIVAHDLDALSAFYRSLGFKLGARNTHPWLTQNHIVQFSGCFLELVSTADGFVKPDASAPESGFALGVANYLDRREGAAMLVLESPDIKADHAEFKSRGIGKGDVFRFGRKGKRPDGSEVELAFSVSFTDGSTTIPGQGFFVCEQHFPDAFWNPAFQQHENAVTGIDAIVVQAPQPDDCMDFLLAFSGATTSHPITGGRAIETGRGRIEVMTEAGLRTIVGNAAPDVGPGPAFAAVRFASKDLSARRAALEKGKTPFTELNGRLVVGSEAAHGVALVFEAVQ